MAGSAFRVEYQPALEPSRKKHTPEPERRSWRRRLLRAASALGALVLALALPFLLLVRLSAYFYSARSLGTWLSLTLAALSVFTLLLLYVVALRLRFQRKPTVPRWMRRGLVVVVAGYVAYGLFYLSGANAKTSEIRSAYVALSPILRIATGTVLLVDRDAVVTDVGRTREDYISWGLPVNEASLHFEQENGFVHAVDLRTQGRPQWRNRALQTYYALMGFRTLRHVGTADHLHVSLPVAGR